MGGVSISRRRFVELGMGALGAVSLGALTPRGSRIASAVWVWLRLLVLADGEPLHCHALPSARRISAVLPSPKRCAVRRLLC